MYSRLRLRNCLARGCRPFMSGVALVSFLPLALGIPLPCVVKTDGRPFPCQNRGCGCANLEQCLGDCCCLSPREKQAWRNGTPQKPPADLARTQNPRADTCCGCCCGEPSGCGDGCTGNPLTCPMCAAKSSGSCCPANVSAPPTEQQTARRSGKSVPVTALQVLGCRGQAPPLFTVSLALASAPPTAEWYYDWSLTGWLRLTDCSSTILCLTPPEPPPRGEG